MKPALAPPDGGDAALRTEYFVYRRSSRRSSVSLYLYLHLHHAGLLRLDSIFRHTCFWASFENSPLKSCAIRCHRRLSRASPDQSAVALEAFRQVDLLSASFAGKTILFFFNREQARFGHYSGPCSLGRDRDSIRTLLLLLYASTVGLVASDETMTVLGPYFVVYVSVEGLVALDSTLTTCGPYSVSYVFRLSYLLFGCNPVWGFAAGLAASVGALTLVGPFTHYAPIICVRP